MRDLNTRLPRGSVLAGVALAVLAAGCRGSTEIEDRWPSYTVSGRVLSAAGVPVVGAAVTVSRQRRSCPVDRAEAVIGPVTTDHGGAYSGAFADPAGSFTGCLAVRVTPPASSGLAERVLDRDSVTFRAPEGPTRATFDVVLSPAS